MWVVIWNPSKIYTTKNNSFKNQFLKIISWCYGFIKFQSVTIYRSSHPEVFLGKGAMKICSQFTGEHPCWSAISIKLLCNFIEITLWHGCSPVNLLHIFRTPFLKNTSGGLLLNLSILRVIHQTEDSWIYQSKG